MHEIALLKYNTKRKNLSHLAIGFFTFVGDPGSISLGNEYLTIKKKNKKKKTTEKRITSISSSDARRQSFKYEFGLH